eukprot:1661746-Alexandrium_andersonii.AAC.1
MRPRGQLSLRWRCRASARRSAANGKGQTKRNGPQVKQRRKRCASRLDAREGPARKTLGER